MKKRLTLTTKMINTMMSAMSGPMLSCEKATRLSTRAIDEKLSFSDAMRLKMHIMMCKWCKRYQYQINMIRDAIRGGANDPEISMNGSLRPEVRVEMQEAIDRESDR